MNVKRYEGEVYNAIRNIIGRSDSGYHSGRYADHKYSDADDKDIAQMELIIARILNT
jgi:hypothetical protein